jgi:hypothetical protein
MTAPLFAALVLAPALLVTACTRSLGPTPVGTLGSGTEEAAVMRLRPDVQASSCRRWILGIPIDGSQPEDPVTALVTGLLAQEPEATLLSEADVRWDHLSLGIYERQCIAVRGNLGRAMRTITIPSGAGGHHPHH